MGYAARILIGGELEPEVLEGARRSTFVEVKDPEKQYSSFAWRLALSVIIATGGIAAGSTAVVIGAMLIAPLMSPMLGTTLAAVIGDYKATIRTLFITFAGVAASIAVAALVAVIIPVDIDTTTNSEVLSRVTPRLVDLIVALAAGLMAALSVMRKDIPDAVPGIAISASIVPPLCVAGVAFQAGDIAAAFGALVLFFANYFGIQVVSILVFLVLGIGRKQGKILIDRARATWYVSAAIGFILVGCLLAYTSFGMVREAAQERELRDMTKEWLADTGYEMYSIDMGDNELHLEIAGTGQVPSVDGLHEMLEAEGIELDVVKAVVLYEKVSDYGEET